MRHLRLTAVLAVAISCALAGLAAQSASAGAPEIGRCVLKVGTGKYKDSGCTKFKLSSSYEWESLVAPGFTLKGSTTQLKWPGGTVTCTNAQGDGQWLNPKEAEEELFLLGCKDGAKECTSPGNFGGEIYSSVLTGVLVWENRSTLNAALDLHGSPVMLEFSCGPEETAGSVFVQLEGSVLAKVEAGSMQLEPEEVYAEAGGKQSPSSYDTSGFFNHLVTDVPEVKTGADGTCVHVGFGGNWTDSGCGGLSMPPHRGEWCRVAEPGCRTTGSAEEAVLTIANMTEKREEPLEVNNVRGSAGHILVLVRRSNIELSHAAQFQLTGGPLVLEANGEPVVCNSSRMEGDVEENVSKKGKASLAEFVTTGTEEGGACSSKLLGPALVTWSGTPYSMEMKVSKGTGVATLKGTKRIVVKAVFPEAGGLSCSYEAAKLSGTFPTLLPMDVTFSEAAFKRSKASSGECPGAVRLNADLNVTSEGEQVEAELR